MRASRVTPILAALLLASLAAVPAAHADLDVSFAVPANATGTLEGAGFERLVLLLPAAGPATLLTLRADGPATVTNHTSRQAHAVADGHADVELPVPGPDADSATMDLDGMELRGHRAGDATLVVEARAITLYAQGAAARILHRLDGTLASQQLAGAADDHAYRVPSIPPEHVHAIGAATSLRFAAEGVRRVEWHNLAPACASTSAAASACPPAGGRSATGASPVAGRSAAVESHSYIEALLADGRLDGTLDAGTFLAAGRAVDLRADGAVRLPLAQGHAGCANCTMPDGRTLTVQGDVQLGAVATREDGRMRATLAGTLSAAAYDEQAVAPGSVLGMDPSLASLAAVGAGLGLWAVLKLLPLLTRLRDPLGHPRRRAVLEYVQQRPGATFREVVRGTGLAVGSGRHHLAVLKRSGVLVERRHGHSLRYFENHGKYLHGWQGHVLLREPALATLHAWVQANPAQPQKAILDAHATQGWPARTTRSRLHRLTVAGLVTAEPIGRQKLYRAVTAEAAAPQPVPAPA